jgi:hypothetical protein
MRWLMTGMAAAAFVLGAVGPAAAGRGAPHSGGSSGHGGSAGVTHSAGTVRSKPSGGSTTAKKTPAPSTPAPATKPGGKAPGKVKPGEVLRKVPDGKGLLDLDPSTVLKDSTSNKTGTTFPFPTGPTAPAKTGDPAKEKGPIILTPPTETPGGAKKPGPSTTPPPAPAPGPGGPNKPPPAGPTTPPPGPTTTPPPGQPTPTPPPTTPPPTGKPTGGRDYPTKWGKRFGDGWCYPGRDHRQWTCRYQWEKYDCTCYYCPYTTCWYYWCEVDVCYYPVSHIVKMPPAPGIAQTPPPRELDALPAFGPDGAPLQR